MPIDSSRLTAAKSATLDAATRARDGKAISEPLFKQLTDGSISLQDWAAALSAKNESYGSFIDAQVEGGTGASAGELAHQLFVSVNDQREAQGMVRTLARTVAELVTK